MSPERYDAGSAAGAPTSSWLTRWWRVMDLRMGVVPVPVAVLIVVLVAGALARGGVKSDLLHMIAILSVGGFACAELGKRLPWLNQIGAAAILATFVPSFLVYVGAIPPALKTAIADFTDQSNFLYLFIAAIIVGSILSMDRKLLISGFVRIVLPLALGSGVAVVVGTSVAAAMGMDPRHTLFFVIVPIMAGGVGEGAIPLSVGYAHMTGRPDGAVFAELLPAVMFASLTAILFAGCLNLLGKRFPTLTGEGRLSIEDRDAEIESAAPPGAAASSTAIGAATVTAVTLYLVGVTAQALWNWPAPVTMLFVAVLLKLGRVFSPSLEHGAFGVYQFFRTAVTYPLLFAIGVAKTPWDKLLSALQPANVVTIVATVAAMMATAFVVARAIRMHPIDVAIVAACHSGQGGTGDVAILTAANRMQLMPFAQIATRIGGALTVTAALAAMAMVGAR
jgi:malate:Na+ symporter